MNQSQQINLRYHQINIIIIMIVMSCLFAPTMQFAIKMEMDTTSTTPSIASYTADIGSCSCDIHDSICDNFCCCDTTCSNSQISSWTSSKACKSMGKSLQTQCDRLSQGSFISFQDLACVYYSNRAGIGYFYQYPQTASIVYPTPAKFAAQASSAQSINSISSAAGTTPYSSSSSSQYLLKMSKDGAIKYFQLWSPVAGGICGVGYANITSTDSFSCDYALSSASCLTSTDLLKGATTPAAVCKNGACSATVPLPTINVPTVSGTTCNSLITKQQLQLTISSTGSQYSVDTAKVTITQQNIDFAINPRYPVKTIVTIKKASPQSSGNPGFIMGKPVGLQNSGAVFNIAQIADVTGACSASGGTTNIQVLFGQNAVYSCTNANACGSSLYIDSLGKQQTLKIQKWAKGSADMIQIGGTSSSLNTCASDSVVLNILYSTAGWQLDQQYYIIGSSLTSQSTRQATKNQKFLKIKWIYADPSIITSPPANMFYSYFSYLWKPLRQYFGVY